MLYFIGFETLIGYNDIKTATGVSFYVQRQNEFTSFDKVIQWDKPIFNIGSAMDPSTGIFTTPVNGLYNFGFTSISYLKGDTNIVYLRLNGVNTARSMTGTHGYSQPILAILSLKKGDKIDIYQAKGSINGRDTPRTMFFGFLLEEYLFL